MPAQSAAAVVLQYGPQAAQQSAASVVLNYASNPVAAVSTLVKSSTIGAWAKASRRLTALFAPQPATVTLDHSPSAPWDSAAARNLSTAATHPATDDRDTARAAPWLTAHNPLNHQHAQPWPGAANIDDQATATWWQFGDMLNEDQNGYWHGSIPTDDTALARWIRPRLPVQMPVVYVRPLATAAHFAVIGEGIRAQFQSAAYTPPASGAITAQFNLDPYIPPFYQPDWDAYQPPPASAAHILYAPPFAPAFDAFGHPVTAIAQADPYQAAPWGRAKPANNDAPHPWRVYSRPLNPGWGVPTPGGPVDPLPGETITIPIQRVYIVLNEVQLIRIAGLTPITALTVNVAFDVDSWLPQFSATIPESARDAIMPDPNPVEIGVFINGTQFNFLVEKIQRNRQFGQRSISIGGRGIACELDAPYAVASHHTQSTDQTAQQIIDAALQYTTYTQTWGITDWLIPGNTFSHFGTPASVATQIAEASGSVLQADRELRNLRMLPRYPVKPWDWATATPEYIIPADIAQTESIEWIEKPTYNVVYVSGTQNGVLGQVKITGTAGDKPAPMVTHPLITHNDAARQRGISILSDTGRKAMMQITMPVLESSGIIDVCRLIEFSDGSNTRRGLVRANSVSVNWPTVRQTLTVEAAV